MPDPYLNPDSQPEASLQAMMTRLEERGKDSHFSKMISNYVSSLPEDEALCALDLGCGTGVVARQLAERLHSSSEVHGADISNELLAEAARLDLGGEIQWDHLEIGSLPYADETFDVITMHTLLSHVEDPVSILMEAGRVLKKKGGLIIFDGDHAGTTYSQIDYETTRRRDHRLVSAITVNPDICRRLPRFLKAVGFKIADHVVDVISECGKGDYWLSSVQGFARMLPNLDALSEKEADEWVDYMLKSHEQGTFFAAGSYYTFYVERSNSSC